MFAANALTGVTVLDLTRLLPGPMATRWLVEMGARVIKIEDRGAGDYMRAMNPALFEMANRGKEFAALDLKSEADREEFLALVDTADVVVEGFRPGVMERLGVGWETLRARNPRLVYVAITGYGHGSRYRDMAGHDINYLAMAGVLDLIGVAGGAPVVPGVQIADLAGGSMYAVMGLLAALSARERTGEGSFVDAGMTQGAALLLPVAYAAAEAGRTMRRGEDVLCGRYACYNVYEARDGRYVAVGALEGKFWAALCRGLGREDLIGEQFAEDPRRSEVIGIVAGIMRERDAEEWFSLLGDADACLTPVRTAAEGREDFGGGLI
ncbi:MAG: CoA transferase [Bryobacterales bacterium]|nr:CoA transferase [Bryobacterales bacterium]